MASRLGRNKKRKNAQEITRLSAAYAYSQERLEATRKLAEKYQLESVRMRTAYDKLTDSMRLAADVLGEGFPGLSPIEVTHIRDYLPDVYTWRKRSSTCVSPIIDGNDVRLVDVVSKAIRDKIITSRAYLDYVERRRVFTFNNGHIQVAAVSISGDVLEENSPEVSTKLIAAQVSPLIYNALKGLNPYL